MQPRAEEGVMNRVQLDVQVTIQEREVPSSRVGEQLSRRVYNRRSVELTRYGYTDRGIGCQYARLGWKPTNHNEECRAGIVRRMTANDNHNQRVQIAQNRTVEATPSEARTGEREERRSDWRSELKNKHLRVQLVQIHGVPAAVRAVKAVVSVRIQQ